MRKSKWVAHFLGDFPRARFYYQLFSAAMMFLGRGPWDKMAHGRSGGPVGCGRGRGVVILALSEGLYHNNYHCNSCLKL